MAGLLILAGDVGGTKTYLGLFQSTGNGFTSVAEHRYSSADFAGPAELLAAFVAHTGHRPDRVVLGVPGSVRHLPVKPVNLPWCIDPDQVRTHLGVAEVHLLNDLQATAYGTLALRAEDLSVLNPGQVDREGNIAVIAAGTGLGEGGLFWAGHRYVSIASEGGHTDFSPSTDLEAELWRYLFDRYGHVSWERVVSGPGLVHLYDFLRETGRGKEPDWLRRELEQGDRAGVIAQAAMEGSCPLAAQAFDLFVSLYGAEAGNLALKLLATGGVYVAGGIAPKIAGKLQEGRFMKAFRAKGRMADTVGTMPVRIVLNDRAGLLGAAHWGAQLDRGV
jgi:glucokinase